MAFPTDSATPFPTTQWSMVLQISPGNGAERDPKTVERFLKTYWVPLKSFVESIGVPRADAEDITQEVFAAIHRMDQYAKLHPDKGRMRGYLKTSAKHRVFEFHRKASRKKRGGGIPPIPLEDYLVADDLVEPEMEFDRRWALHLLELTSAQMERDYASRKRLDLFQSLFPIMTLEVTKVSYAEVAKKLGMTEGSIKVAAHRMKEKYRKVLRAEVAKTVVSEEEIDQEIAALFSALSGS